jgi:Transposase DDE domain group 1
MENRIKEQMMLFADRTSTSWLRSNQIRLYFSTVAYQLMQALRRLGLTGTELAQAQCHTVRLKLLKIGALVRITVRKVWICWSASYPYAERFRRVFRQLQSATPVRC